MGNRSIRKITPEDNEEIGKIIRNVLIEYDAAQAGTAFEDPDLFNLFSTYQQYGGVYYVALLDGELVGGCGIGPLPGVEGVCELQKMYLSPHARKKGLASQLLECCIQYAVEVGYRHCYLETLPSMHEAQNLYKKYGFKPTNDRMGHTGHFTCDFYMIKEL